MLLDADLERHVGKYYGKYSGEVSDNQDEQHTGCITVKVPSLENIEVYARPCLPYGHFFVPAVGTQVWIEFEGGDVNFPIWVGCWYPEGAAPPEASIKPPDNRVILTASGHTIELLDKEGEEKILIRHKNNAFITIDKKGSVLISNEKGSHLFLDAEGEKTTLVEQHGNTLIMRDGDLLLVNQDGATLELKGDLVRVLAANIALQGSSVALGQGAMEPTVLGQTFAPLYLAHTHATAVGPSGPPLPPPTMPIPWLSSAVVVK
jgi:Type VI secretion system/phage-baseplate injector OB domain